MASEIPFNLMVSGSWVYPFHQNTVFTLLLGCLLIWGLESSLRPWKKTALVAAWCFSDIFCDALTFSANGGRVIHYYLLKRKSALFGGNCHAHP